MRSLIIEESKLSYQSLFYGACTSFLFSHNILYQSLRSFWGRTMSPFTPRDDPNDLLMQPRHLLPTNHSRQHLPRLRGLLPTTTTHTLFHILHRYYQHQEPWAMFSHASIVFPVCSLEFDLCPNCFIGRCGEASWLRFHLKVPWGRGTISQCDPRLGWNHL